MQFQNLRKYTKTKYFKNHIGKGQLITSKMSIFCYFCDHLVKTKVTSITTSYTLSIDKAFFNIFPPNSEGQQI